MKKLSKYYYKILVKLNKNVYNNERCKRGNNKYGAI